MGGCGSKLLREDAAETPPRSRSSLTSRSLRSVELYTTAPPACAPAAATANTAPAANQEEDDDPTAPDDADESFADLRMVQPKVMPMPCTPRVPIPTLPVTPTPAGPPPQGSDRPTMDGAQDAIAWLYCEGKAAFDRKEFTEALHSFEYCFQRLAERASGGGEAFDASHPNYRHLEHYLDLCRTREELAKQRVIASSPDVRHQLSATPPALHATGSGHGAGGSPALQPPQPPALVGAPSAAGGGSTWSPGARETLIFVCSPKHSALALPHLADEAVDVANVTTAHIRRGGTANDLRNELLQHRYKAFLFSGHGDAELSGKQQTLAFTGAAGGLDTVRPEHLAELLGHHSPKHGGTLDVVFLNGCCTEQIGRSVHRAGVTYVVAWRTRAETKAAHLLASTFFGALASGRGHVQAFEDAKSAVKLATRPGKTEAGMPSAVPAYELRDPLEPVKQADASFTPPPMAAGVPVLFCAEYDNAERSGSGDSRNAQSQHTGY